MKYYYYYINNILYYIFDFFMLFFGVFFIKVSYFYHLCWFFSSLYRFVSSIVFHVVVSVFVATEKWFLFWFSYKKLIAFDVSIDIKNNLRFKLYYKSKIKN